MAIPKNVLQILVYQVEFPDGHTQECSANIVAQNWYSQLDDEGRQHLLLDEIIDFEVSEDAFDNNDRFQVSFNGNIHPIHTTKGWRLCVKWKDGSTSWESYKDLKEAYPVQVAEFVVSRGIDDYVTFRWWAPSTLRYATHMIKAVKSRMTKKTHKYGIRVPHSIEEAYQLDKETGSDYWHQAILKEMKITLWRLNS
jgi:hypothetical protein